MRIKTVIGLWIIIVSSFSSRGQNLGFVSKHSTIGLGLDASISLSSKNMLPTLCYEHSLGYKLSVFGSFSSFNAISTFDGDKHRLEAWDKFIVSRNHGPEQDIALNGPYILGGLEANVKVFKYGLKYYRIRTGAIAPYGKFIGFGVVTNMITILESDMYLSGYQNYARNKQRDVKVLLSHEDKLRRSTNVGIFLSFGEKRFLNRNQFLEYSISFNLDGISSFSTWDGYSHHMGAAHALIYQKILLPQFLNFNFIYGIAV